MVHRRPICIDAKQKRTLRLMSKILLNTRSSREQYTMIKEQTKQKINLS